MNNEKSVEINLRLFPPGILRIKKKKKPKKTPSNTDFKDKQELKIKKGNVKYEPLKQ